MRDPIERAVSFYYFVKDSNIKNYKHPLRDYADSVSIKQFHENRKMQNWQTRYIAGFISDRLYSKIPHKPLEKRIIDRAKVNLKDNYYCFGILEKYEESVQRFLRKFGFQSRLKVPYRMKTKKRVKVTDLDDITLLTLKKAHALDIELYNFALNLFEER